MLSPRTIKARMLSRSLIFKLKGKLEEGQWFSLQTFQEQCEINYIIAERAINLAISEEHLTSKKTSNETLYSFT